MQPPVKIKLIKKDYGVTERDPGDRFITIRPVP